MDFFVFRENKKKPEKTSYIIVDMGQPFGKKIATFFESSIRNRLIAVLILATLIPVSASTILSYVYSKRHMKDISITENLNILSKSEINISNYVDTLISTTLSMYSNSRMYSILEFGSQSAYDFETRPYVMSTMQSILVSNQSIEQVFLECVNNNNSSYLLTKRGFFSSTNSSVPREESGLSDVTIFPTHISHSFGLSPSIKQPNSLVFSIERIISSIPEKKYLGLITLDVNLSYLSQILNSLQNDARETVAIINAEGDVICSTESGNNGLKIGEYPWISAIINSEEPVGELWSTDLENERELLVFQKFKISGQYWIIYKSIPESYLYRDANKLLRNMLLVSGLFLAVSLILMIRISIDFTRPIQQMNDHIQQIQRGETDSHIEINSKNEIGNLADSFNSMMDTINKMVINEYRLKLSNRTNQLSALQAQIDSHFINNSIQSIGAGALRSGNMEIYKLLSSFGEMFNYSMNLQPFVILKNEIDYTENYFVLQKERFPDKLNYKITYDHGIENILVPKMLLQPIVENYFKHGFASSYDGGTVHVQISDEGKEVLISVEDDGAGIPVEKMEKIKKEFSTIENRTDLIQAKEHIGLANLAMRLALYYGGNASIDIGNLSEGGFFIHVYIPKDLENFVQVGENNLSEQEIQR